jgi:hypothetical protein
LRSKGINDLALNWREKVEEWNKTWLEKCILLEPDLEIVN